MKGLHDLYYTVCMNVLEWLFTYLSPDYINKYIEHSYLKIFYL